ncbi:MAG: aminotransferase class I/II-fold pyridoxal phosphate-dependent enzyme, partial [Actinobacteria bacterium]|nr:aminotransferase class I/II-fold pyridoxal phosphate-dependent enzyme [Actinomycetota bacterium]
LDERSVAEGLAGPVDIAVLCSPNNPTGGVESLEVVEQLLKDVPLVIVDEAYVEFARSGSSALGLLQAHENLVITRTFSKAWRLAGARLGYLLAHPSVIQGLMKVRLPYHLSSPSQLLGLAALRHSDETLAAVEAIKGERAAISEGLTAMGVCVYPSDANFILFETQPAGEGKGGTKEVWATLLERGVLVRDYSNHPLLSNCLRVTAGTAEETTAFLEAVEEVLGAQATI